MYGQMWDGLRFFVSNIQMIFSLWIQHHLTPRAERGQAVLSAGM